jgi:hypothetical protein
MVVYAVTPCDRANERIKSLRFGARVVPVPTPVNDPPVPMVERARPENNRAEQKKRKGQIEGKPKKK